MERDAILHRVRSALGRTGGQPVPEPPRVYLRIPEWTTEQRIVRFTDALEALGGKVHRAARPADVAEVVSGILNGRSAVRSSGAFLGTCGMSSVAGVSGPLPDRESIRRAAATLDLGITSAEYALAETGTLVMIQGPEESRLISLLPPAYICVVPVSRMLVNLDELLSILPRPAEQTSAMVLITGPSRTADIEQILVRGVHGPGEIHVVLVDLETDV